MKALLFLLAVPLFGQITVTCPSPGNVATVSWNDPVHPSLYVRIEQNADGLTTPHRFPGPGLQQRGPTSASTASFITQPGPYDAYLFQDTPYWQSASVSFTCAAPVGCAPCKDGPPGPKGDKGDTGPPGPPGPTGGSTSSTMTITSPGQRTTVPSFSCEGLTGFNYTIDIPQPPDVCHITFIPIPK